MLRISIIIFCISIGFYMGKSFGEYQSKQSYFYEVAQEVRGQS